MCRIRSYLRTQAPSQEQLSTSAIFTTSASNGILLSKCRSCAARLLGLANAATALGDTHRKQSLLADLLLISQPA